MRDQNRLIYVDALRAVAIISVMFCHMPPELMGTLGPLQVFGGRGVDLFFVLSGFLIGSTTLSRAEWQASVWDKFKTFWLLRTFRIWPLYFGLLLLYVALPKVFDPAIKQTILDHPVPYATFTSNYFYQGTLELGVLWSLAIEEQFYVVIGLLVGVASARRDVLSAAFFGVSLVAIVVSLRYRLEVSDLFQAKQMEQNTYIGKIFHGTLGRMDQLSLGILASLCARWVSARLPLASSAWAWMAVAAAVLAIMYVPQWPVVGHTALGLVFVACVLVTQIRALRAPSLLPIRLLASTIALVGKVSFGLYLFHPFVRRWLFPLWQRIEWHNKTIQAALFLCTWLAVTLAIAWLSYRFFEAPLLRWARARGAQPGTSAA
jgi:peptidoglycan/LPS O-acetylase OafA/YrhL